MGLKLCSTFGLYRLDSRSLVSVIGKPNIDANSKLSGFPDAFVGSLKATFAPKYALAA
jgi:hypothetical protein